jgi:hypothetical protein
MTAFTSAWRDETAMNGAPGICGATKGKYGDLDFVQNDERMRLGK